MSGAEEADRLEGLKFECTECGECCLVRGDYAYVYLNEEESARLAEFLGIEKTEFRERYTFRDRLGWTQLEFRGDRCVFLEEEGKRCTVHPARPTQCRTFPFWREFVVDGRWTERVAAMCEGIGRGPSHSSEEAERQMLEQEVSDEE